MPKNQESPWAIDEEKLSEGIVKESLVNIKKQIEDLKHACELYKELVKGTPFAKCLKDFQKEHEDMIEIAEEETLKKGEFNDSTSYNERALRFLTLSTLVAEEIFSRLKMFDSLINRQERRMRDLELLENKSLNDEEFSTKLNSFIRDREEDILSLGGNIENLELYEGMSLSAYRKRLPGGIIATLDNLLNKQLKVLGKKGVKMMQLKGEYNKRGDSNRKELLKSSRDVVVELTSVESSFYVHARTVWPLTIEVEASHDFFWSIVKDSRLSRGFRLYVLGHALKIPFTRKKILDIVLGRRNADKKEFLELLSVWYYFYKDQALLRAVTGNVESEGE